jgi:hypothetical protein
MVPTRPRLIYQASIRRKVYFRRFMWSLLGAAGAAGAFVALDETAGRQLDGVTSQIVDHQVLQIGGLIALVIGVLFGLRALLNFWRWLTRRNEELRFFDQGFSWKRGSDEYKSGWTKLKAYREGAHGIYLGGRPILQWGAHRLTMRDGRVFRVTGTYGDTRRFAKAVRQIAADYTGTWMGRALRHEQPVRLHRQLTLYPGGVHVGKHSIPWSELDTGLRRGRLVILRQNAKGKFKTVKSFNPASVDNVQGFLELAHGTIRNWQRERFEKRESQEVARR